MINEKEIELKIRNILTQGNKDIAYALLDEVIEYVDKWLMLKTNLDVNKIVDLKEDLRKHFI